MLIEWMFKVIETFNQNEMTLFRAIAILDSYMALEKTQFDLQKFHLFGCISILLASKLEEVHPITNVNVYKDLCHEKFSLEEILQTERHIIETLHFKINFPTKFNFKKFFLGKLELTNECKNFIDGKSDLLYKMILLSSDISSKFSDLQISLYVIIITLKLFEHKYKENNISQKVSKLITLLKEPKEQILKNLNYLRIYIRKILTNQNEN